MNTGKYPIEVLHIRLSAKLTTTREAHPCMKGIVAVAIKTPIAIVGNFISLEVKSFYHKIFELSQNQEGRHKQDCRNRCHYNQEGEDDLKKDEKHFLFV